MKKSRTVRPSRRTAVVAATTAAKNFGALVDRVRESGVAWVIERKGRPIVRIEPVTTSRCTIGDLARWFGTRRTLPDEYVTAVTRHVKTANTPRVPRVEWQP